MHCFVSHKNKIKNKISFFYTDSHIVVYIYKVLEVKLKEFSNALRNVFFTKTNVYLFLRNNKIKLIKNNNNILFRLFCQLFKHLL